MTNEELNIWERSTGVIEVLTCKEFGAWLHRRDMNIKAQALEAQQTCENINEDYADCDQFKCSECQIELQDWHRVERDEDDGDITYHEYEFRYCPNCGRRVKRNE